MYYIITVKQSSILPTNYESLRDTYLTVLEENNDLQVRNAKLEQELSWLKRQVFGQKSERFLPVQDGQTVLDLAAVSAEEKAAVTTQDIAAHQRHIVTEAPKKGHGRMALPINLPRVEIVIEPKEDVTGLKKIGEEICESLEYKPGRFFVNRYIRPKYAKADGSSTVITAYPPSRPIDKGIPGASLLAYIMICKFVDHLPLYRIVNILARDGVKISLPTLCGWIEGSYNLLLPLYHELIKKTLATDYLQLDESTVKVLDDNYKGKTHLGYFWVYRNPLERLLFFDYRKSRSGESPSEMLLDFQGYLQTDGYSGYGDLQRRSDIIPVACMAHARRKFYEAQEKGSSKSKEALELFGKLYAVEAEARDSGLNFTERKDLRTEKAKPVLEELKAWLDKELLTALPKSPMGLSIAYSLNRWSYLKEYVNDGRLEMDNNLIENAIRPVAIGRKNWLFAGSHDGADRAALIYSLVGTCKANGIEPYEYLRKVLEEMPDCKKSDIHKLLPTEISKKE